MPALAVRRSALAVRRTRVGETGRLIMVGPRWPRSPARYHRKAVARSPIARKAAIKHDATTVSVTKRRADFVMTVPLASKTCPFSARFRLPPAYSRDLPTLDTDPAPHGFTIRAKWVMGWASAGGSIDHPMCVRERSRARIDHAAQGCNAI